MDNTKKASDDRGVGKPAALGKDPNQDGGPIEKGREGEAGKSSRPQSVVKLVNPVGHNANNLKAGKSSTGNVREAGLSSMRNSGEAGESSVPQKKGPGDLGSFLTSQAGEKAQNGMMKGKSQKT